MELLVKVGNKYPKGHPQHEYGWKDGQVVDIRPDGYYKRKYLGRCLCVIQTQHDYWKLRGSRDWKWFGRGVQTLKSMLVTKDPDLGKYPWEMNESQYDAYGEKDLRKRDRFIDFKRLLDDSILDRSTFDSVYDKSRVHSPIYIDRDLDSYLLHEDAASRRPSDYSNRLGSISSGTYYIGSGDSGSDPGYDGYYSDVTAFEAAIAATLTGNLTGEHNNEETTISAGVVFSFDCADNKFTLTAQSGDEHNGSGYGNGARINYGTSDYIQVDNYSMDDCEISKLAIDASGASNYGIYLYKNAPAGVTLLNRLLIKLDDSSGSPKAIYFHDNMYGTTHIRNSIIYGPKTASNITTGIYLNSYDTNAYLHIYNNTIVGFFYNVYQDQSSLAPTTTMKNNLSQGPYTCYKDDGAGFGTTAKNISEDATSPDASYQSKTIRSQFKSYATGNYLLWNGGGGDFTDLDDGEDLSGTFTDDVRGKTRSTWYIGASELQAAGTTSLQNQGAYQALDQGAWQNSGVAATTLAPTTLAPTTLAPTTLPPTTLAPTTLAPTTLPPTTLAPTTLPPTTLPPTTLAPTTLAPTTLPPTTLAPTTLAPTTLPPTTLAPTTLAPTTLAPTTLAPTTAAPTTAAPTTLAPTTVAPTTLPPTTLPPTTLAPTTLAPTTLAPTTLAPTTSAPTTLAPTTLAPTTLAPTTLAPTTLQPTTVAPTTLAPTTLPPTTLPPTTLAPTTAPPTTVSPTTVLTTHPPTEAMLVMKVGPTSPPGPIQSRIWKDVSGGSAGGILLGFIPPGYYFEAVEYSPTATKYRWIEVTWS